MADYFVRLSGSDSNNGTSAATAWRTIGKALGASGISSGDRVFVGAGTYRETVSVGMTSATAETKIIGDVSGQYTGDAGEVVWSAQTNGDHRQAAQVLLTLAGRSYLTFEQITFLGGTGGVGGSCINATTTTSTNITLRNCTFLYQNRCLVVTAAAGTALTWLIEGCRIAGLGLSCGFTATTSASGADYDLGVIIRNCLFLTPGAQSVYLGASGTATYRGNGITLINCSGMCSTILQTEAAISTTYPSVVKNNSFWTSSNTYIGGAAGQITDGGGNRNMSISGATNVTLAATSSIAFGNALLIEVGQSAVLGLPYRHPLMPYAASGTVPQALGFGNVTGGTSTSITGRNRPSGSGIVWWTGTATGATSSTLSNSGKTFPTSSLIGKLIRITGGTGAGQVKRISANSGQQITISGAAPAGGLWATTPSTDSTYIIYDGPQVETGKATSATATTLVDAGANWATNQWAGYDLAVVGTGAATVSVVSNTATTLTVASWPNGTPDNTSTYSLYWPGTSLTATQASAGAFELGDTARAEATVTDSGTGTRIDGPGCQDLIVPVDATATTLTVRARYDGNHGTANKPQLQLLAQDELGVAAATATMTSGADTWETLSVGPFTPSATGAVTLRLVSRSATPYGVAYFDTIGAS